jgi:hypothetical protein
MRAGLVYSAQQAATASTHGDTLQPGTPGTDCYTSPAPHCTDQTALPSYTMGQQHDALHAPASDSMTDEAAAEEISRIARSSPRERPLLVQRGFIPELVAVLQKPLQVATGQPHTAAAWALFHLLGRSKAAPQGCPAAQSAMAAVGAVKHLTTVLKAVRKSQGSGGGAGNALSNSLCCGCIMVGSKAFQNCPTALLCSVCTVPYHTTAALKVVCNPLGACSTRFTHSNTSACVHCLPCTQTLAQQARCRAHRPTAAPQQAAPSRRRLLHSCRRQWQQSWPAWPPHPQARRLCWLKAPYPAWCGCWAAALPTWWMQLWVLCVTCRPLSPTQSTRPCSRPVSPPCWCMSWPTAQTQHASRTPSKSCWTWPAQP